MNKELLAQLLPILVQYSVVAIKDVIALIEGNPQHPDETPEAYVTRMGALIDANTAAVDKGDAEIQGT